MAKEYVPVKTATTSTTPVNTTSTTAAQNTSTTPVKNTVTTPTTTAAAPEASNKYTSSASGKTGKASEAQMVDGVLVPYSGNQVAQQTVAEEAQATPAAANTVTSSAANATRAYLDNYNTDREEKIRNMYAGNLASQNAQQQTAYDKNMAALKTAYDANLGNLKTAYDNNSASLKTAYDKNLATIANAYQQNLSDANAYMEGISPRYQESMNALGAEYERQRRNNNMQAAANGLNTGANSQLALGQSMAYQRNQGNLARSENEALNEADRSINDLNRDYYNQQSILDTEYSNNVDKLNREYANQQATYGTTYQNNLLDLKTNYQNKIAEAAANNDYQLAAALLDEYGAQYDRTMAQAEQLAEFGDFSMFSSIYGTEAAQQMENIWNYQNPDLAYNLGRITAEDYFNITGAYPAGYTGTLNGGYPYVAENMNKYGYKTGISPELQQVLASGNYSTVRRYGGGRGYSASRDRAYRGAPGYYNTAGNFVVPATGKSYGSATGSEKYDDTARDEAAKAYAERFV